MGASRWVVALGIATGCVPAADVAPASGGDGSGVTGESPGTPGSGGLPVPGTTSPADATSTGSGSDADESSDADSGGGTSGSSDDATDDGVAFCPPPLTEATHAWKDAYDEHFANKASMRSALANLPKGTGHWGQTYTLRSLGLMYELTGALPYLHELMWQAEEMIELAAGSATWPTGVCSNSFEHSTVVIDGRFLVPLLRAAWWMQHSRLASLAVPTIDGRDFGGATYGEIAESYAATATEVLAGHEGELETIAAESFGPEEGNPSLYYRFPGSYSCVAGDVMPFNYANSAGTAYAELWRLTGDESALEHAEQLLAFWWNRTYAYEPSPGATRSRWYGYRGALGGRFDPDDPDDRPEDVGHADMTGSFADRMFTFGLGSLNATRIDQVAMASKRWVDRTLSTGGAPAYSITNDDHDGEWRDLFDHLPMSCYRGSILEDLAALAPEHLANDGGDYPRAVVENIAEFAFYSEFAASPSPCGPTCGDGVCNGAEDCIACPGDCAPCSQQCDE